MNIQSVPRFDDGGNLTAGKLVDFKSRLRPVNGTQNVEEVAAPVIEEIQQVEEHKIQAQETHRPNRNRRRSLPKAYINRPLPTPPVIQTVQKIIETNPNNTIETQEKTDEKEVLEAVLPVNADESPVEVLNKNLIDETVIEEEKPKKPGFFSRSIHAVGTVAKKVFYAIKNFFETVFGKLFGRVTKIKIAGKEITFDGHQPSRVNTDSTIKIELDANDAKTMRAIATIGGIAANALPPPPAPALPADGKIPVKNWRNNTRPANNEVENEKHGINIKEMVEKKRQENAQSCMFNLLAKELAGFRKRGHLDDDIDDDSDFFEISFETEDKKQTNLSFDGVKTISVNTEIGRQNSRTYTGLQKKQQQETENRHITKTTLADAMKNLTKVEVEESDKKTTEEDSNNRNLLLAGFMKNAAHLLQHDD